MTRLPSPALPPIESLPFTWSVEHLLLAQVCLQPYELSTLLTGARTRHRAHPHLVGKLQLTPAINGTWGAIVEHGYAERSGPGYVLTRRGEGRLDYLYTTQVLVPYLKRLERTHGRDVAQQLARELIP